VLKTSQNDPNGVSQHFKDSLLLERYYKVFAKEKNDSRVPHEINELLSISFGSNFKSSLQSKKLSTSRPLTINNSSKIALIACKPTFSFVEVIVDTSCDQRVVENAGYNISKDIAQLTALFVKSDISNKIIKIEYMQFDSLNEIPFENYTFKKSFVPGPTKIWGNSERPDCYWPEGVAISRKPQIKKNFKFTDKSLINGEYNYILAVWPYQYFSGWAGYEEYSMYFVFTVIDGKSGQILGSGLCHKDKFCDSYCGMEVALNVSIEISSQFLKALISSE